MGLEELKAVLRYNKITYKSLAEALNTSVSTVNDKINCKRGREFNRVEIKKIANILGLEESSYYDIFFKDNLQKRKKTKPA